MIHAPLTVQQFNHIVEQQLLLRVFPLRGWLIPILSPWSLLHLTPTRRQQ